MTRIYVSIYYLFWACSGFMHCYCKGKIIQSLRRENLWYWSTVLTCASWLHNSIPGNLSYRYTRILENNLCTVQYYGQESRNWEKTQRSSQWKKLIIQIILWPQRKIMCIYKNNKVSRIFYYDFHAYFYILLNAIIPKMYYQVWIKQNFKNTLSHRLYICRND
jgi:hypothetical protein